MTDEPSINELLQSAATQGAAGDLSAAEQALVQVLEQDPQHAQALHMLGVTLWQAGRAQAALHALQRAITFAPEHAQTHYVLAKVTEQVHGPREAIAGYARTVELAPQFAPAWADLGIAQAESGALSSAIEALYPMVA